MELLSDLLVPIMGVRKPRSVRMTDMAKLKQQVMALVRQQSGMATITLTSIYNRKSHGSTRILILKLMSNPIQRMKMGLVMRYLLKLDTNLI